MIPIEVIAGAIGTIFPIAAKLVGKIFGKKSNQSPTEALDDIALARPEILPQYIEGLSKLNESKVKWFQRDVTEGVNPFVASFRASIRPGVVVFSFILFFLDMVFFYFKSQHVLDEGTRAAFAGYIGTWMGDRIDL